jgi:Protein of unknown function (DUF4240)
MRLGTLLLVGALVFRGLFVARNADEWMNRLHEAKTHLVTAVNERVAAEEARVGTAVNRRLAKERAKAAAALKQRLEQERANAVAALKQRLAQERATTFDALKERLARERAQHGGGTEAARETVPAPPEASGPSDVPQSPTIPQSSTVPEPRAGPAMTEAEFWRLMSETRNQAGKDTAIQSELLRERLTQLSPEAIVDFARIRRSLDERAYTWDLWGAAHVIEDGCSEDCFRDFRGYLISLGQGPYENALRNPDSLASVVDDAETGNWESADDVALDAYASVTGQELPVDSSDPSGPPSGTPFDENDTAGLATRYPMLAARFD